MRADLLKAGRPWFSGGGASRVEIVWDIWAPVRGRLGFAWSSGGGPRWAGICWLLVGGQLVPLCLMELLNRGIVEVMLDCMFMIGAFSLMCIASSILSTSLSLLTQN